jgi:putative methyltransferase (TIGR04325 family)
MIKQARRLMASVRTRLRPVWSGVYHDYREVPVRGPGFNGGVWVATTRARTQRELSEFGARRKSSTALTGDRALLPLLAATLVGQHESMSILDFGGGMGIGYVDIRRALRSPNSVRYVVVETDEVCAEGRALFASDKSISFVPSLANAGADFQIVHVNSALQYIEDYRRLVRELAAIGAPFMLFVNLSAGEIPTYATAQLNVPGSVLAYWFLNLNEFIAILGEEGYSLVMDVGSERRLRGFALPRDHRIDRGRNLLFVRA